MGLPVLMSREVPSLPVTWTEPSSLPLLLTVTVPSSVE
jgi:hypothetical protein